MTGTELRRGYWLLSAQKSLVVVTQPKNFSTVKTVAACISGGPAWSAASSMRIGKYSRK